MPDALSPVAQDGDIMLANIGFLDHGLDFVQAKIDNGAYAQAMIQAVDNVFADFVCLDHGEHVIAGRAEV